MRYLNKINEAAGAIVYNNEQLRRFLSNPKFRKEFNMVVNKSLQDLYGDNHPKIDVGISLLDILTREFNWYCIKKKKENKQITPAYPERLFEYIWGFRKAIFIKNVNQHPDVQFFQKTAYKHISKMIADNSLDKSKRKEFVKEVLELFYKPISPDNIIMEGDANSTKGFQVYVKNDQETVYICWFASHYTTSVPGQPGVQASAFERVSVPDGLKVDYYLMLNLDSKKYHLMRSENIKIIKKDSKTTIYIPQKNLVKTTYTSPTYGRSGPKITSGGGIDRLRKSGGFERSNN